MYRRDLRSICLVLVTAAFAFVPMGCKKAPSNHSLRAGDSACYLSGRTCYGDGYARVSVHKKEQQCDLQLVGHGSHGQ